MLHNISSSNKLDFSKSIRFILITGSVNMVLRCDAKARNARDWKMAIFKLEYNVFIVGIRITAITTNSA